METKMYSVFKLLPANRHVSERLVAQQMLSIKQNGFIKSRPILVNKYFEIIDGQHRFEACKRLNIPVPYAIIDGDTMGLTIALNTSQKKWSLIDFINSYAGRGLDCYRRLQKFEDKYRFGVSSSIAVFLQNSLHASTEIRAGKNFKINEQAEDIAEFILGCSSLPFFKQQSFCRAVALLFKKAKPEQINLLRARILSVPQCYSMDQYITAFENLLNYKKRGSNKLTLLSK